MRLLRNILTVTALLLSTVMSADEGFWLVQDINDALENNMRAKGLKLRPKEIYNVDAPGSGLADAVVSLGFKYSGSIVSNWGLVLTCADPAIAFMDRLGDVGQQLLKDGFHAVSEAHEIPVEGEKVYSLKRVFDVTEEVRSMRKGGMDYGEITSRLENAYNESTTLMCRLTSEWAGAKYYIAAYKVYDDVRLVVMPPLSLARMGGEDGKWSWPAHRCDFALFRIYDHGKPVSGAKTLDVSLDGYSEGSFAMTIGFPNFTERFLPSAGMRFREEVALPLANSLRSARLEIMKRMIADDKSVGKLYSSRAKELEERLGVDKGVKSFYGSYNLTPAREASEQWMADSFLANLDRVFKATKRVETDKILRDETLRDGLGAVVIGGEEKTESTIQWYTTRKMAMVFLFTHANTAMNKNGVDTSGWDGAEFEGVQAANVRESVVLEGDFDSVRYEISNGALPAGVTLNGETGAISGTPTSKAGTYSFTVRAVVENWITATQRFTINLDSAFEIDETNGKVGEDFYAVISSDSVNDEHYNQGVVYSVKSGSLPKGITLNEDGELEGVPEEAGVFTVLFNVQASNRGSGSRATTTVTNFEYEVTLTIEGDEVAEARVIRALERNARLFNAKALLLR